MESEPDYTLIYFPVYARGEPTRMMLAHGGANWKNEIPGQGTPAWPELKKTLPGHAQLPILKLKDGTLLTQSIAIARFVAKKLGYYPTDDVLACKADQIIDDTYGEEKVFMTIMKPCFLGDKPEEKEAAVKKAFDEALPLLMKLLEPWLKDDGFLLGDKPTLPDFFIGGFYLNIIKNEKFRYGQEDGKWKAWTEDEANKKFVAYGERFAALMKDYLASDKRVEATL